MGEEGLGGTGEEATYQHGGKRWHREQQRSTQQSDLDPTPLTIAPAAFPFLPAGRGDAVQADRALGGTHLVRGRGLWERLQRFGPAAACTPLAPLPPSQTTGLMPRATLLSPSCSFPAAHPLPPTPCLPPALKSTGSRTPRARGTSATWAPTRRQRRQVRRTWPLAHPGSPVYLVCFISLLHTHGAPAT